MKKLKELYLKLFHKHNFKLVKWMFIKDEETNFLRRIYLLKCDKCREEKTYIPVKERDREWEYQMRHKWGIFDYKVRTNK